MPDAVARLEEIRDAYSVRGYQLVRELRDAASVRSPGADRSGQARSERRRSADALRPLRTELREHYRALRIELEAILTPHQKEALRSLGGSGGE